MVLERLRPPFLPHRLKSASEYVFMGSKPTPLAGKVQEKALLQFNCCVPPWDVYYSVIAAKQRGNEMITKSKQCWDEVAA